AVLLRPNSRHKRNQRKPPPRKLLRPRNPSECVKRSLGSIACSSRNRKLRLRLNRRQKFPQGRSRRKNPPPADRYYGPNSSRPLRSKERKASAIPIQPTIKLSRCRKLSL